MSSMRGLSINADNISIFSNISYNN